MARVASILGAIARAVRRDAGTFGSIAGNNFFFFIALMAYGAGVSHIEPKSAYPPLLFLLCAMLFPLSADPLDKVPPSRLKLWPLRPQERIAIRILSILASPVLWIAAVLMLFKRVRPGIAAAFLTAVIGIQILAALGRALFRRMPRGNALRYFPALPGKVGGLIRHNLRQIVQVLDFWIALLLAVGGCIYRWFAAHPEPEALPVLSVMIALALSTYAQVLFGFDRVSAAHTRYRLFPMAGWQILLAKDLSLLAIVALLVAPLDPLPGLSFELFAIAVGHHTSILEKIPLRRWRFASGRAGIGVVQCVGGFILGLSTDRVSPLFAVASAAAWVVSLGIYGRILDRKP